MTPRLKWSSLDLPFTPVSWSAGSSHAMFLDTKGQVWELYPPLYHLAHSYIAVRQESVHAVHVSASSDISAFLTPDGRVYAWWSETPRMWRAHKNYLVATVSSVHYSDGRCQAQELPLVPTSGDEKVVSVEAGRGIVLALTSSGRLYLRYLGEVPQQRQWTHVSASCRSSLTAASSLLEPRHRPHRRPPASNRDVC